MQINLKELILAVFFAGLFLAAIWFWRGAMPLIIAGEFNNYKNLLPPLASLFLSGIFFTFSALFIKEEKIVYILSAIVTIIPLFLLPFPTTAYYAVFGVSVLLMFLAIHRIRIEYNQSAGFSLTRVAKAGLPLYFTVLSLIAAIFYLSVVDEEKAISSIFPQSGLSFLLKKFSGPISNLTGLPEISPDASVDEILTGIVSEGLAKQGISPGKVSKAEFNQILSTQRKELAEQYGLKVTGREKVLDVFYPAIIERIYDLLGPYRVYLPAASAVAFFFAFKTLTFPLYYVLLITIFLLIKFLVLVKILKEEKIEIGV